MDVLPFFVPRISEDSCLDVLPFFVPGNSEGPGKNVWMCFLFFFLETVKTLARMYGCASILFSEGQERMYGSASIFYSRNQ